MSITSFSNSPMVSRNWRRQGHGQYSEHDQLQHECEFVIRSYRIKACTASCIIYMRDLTFFFLFSKFHCLSYVFRAITFQQGESVFAFNFDQMKFNRKKFIRLLKVFVKIRSKGKEIIKNKKLLKTSNKLCINLLSFFKIIEI